MLIKESKSIIQINSFLEQAILKQTGIEFNIEKSHKKQKGIYFTNALTTVDNILDVIDVNLGIFDKKILEPSCGQGILILKLISNVYVHYPDEKLVSSFITNNLYFVDIQDSMINETINNINTLYCYLFDEPYQGTFNSIVWDFTDKLVLSNLFDLPKETPFTSLYNTFDYVIGNPPYVTLYGRRDQKQSEEQRVNYLKNYSQFPDYVRNGKLNLVMLFIEHSLDLLKQNGQLSFIIDVSFFETAYKFTRKYLLEKTKIDALEVNVKDFDVASGQVILKVTKYDNANGNEVRVIDRKTKNTCFILQSDWNNKYDEYKFRYNGCDVSKKLIEKILSKGDNTLLGMFPKKNLRTCVMLLDMEDKFTFCTKNGYNEKLVYPYYQGSKALSEKYGDLHFTKWFFYNKKLQDSINDELKIKLQNEGIKNKKRLGLGEQIIYDNPKIYIRQSAKEIIATIDLEKSSANNSLYIFSLRNNFPKTVELLYFLCGYLNSKIVTYFSQQMNIIRYSQGKQPQIKISDLGTLPFPNNQILQNKISYLTKLVYNTPNRKEQLIDEIDKILFEYFGISEAEIDSITKSITTF